MRSAPDTQATTERPKLLQAAIDAFHVPDLRYRILFTLALLGIFRLIAHVQVPGVDRDALAALFQSNALLGFLDLFSGGALRNLSVAALGVFPYITSSIVMQLLVPVIPRLQALSKEGESGRQQINRIVHGMTVPVAMAQAYGQLLFLQQANVLTGVGITGGSGLATLAMVLSMTAGTMFLVWLGELITEKGIGNGISLLIFAGIVAGFPQLIQQLFLAQDGAGTLLLLGAIWIAMIYLIVLFTEAQRRVPVQYGRSLFRGGRMYRQSGASHLPLRVNSAGMIPLIFAFSIMILPGTIASYLATASGWLGSTASLFARLFNTTGIIYWGLTFLLVVLFTFFYTWVVFQQQNLADNLQKNGGFIPGIRPGKPTADYLNRIIFRITWGGALFLGFIAIMPFLANLVTGVQSQPVQQILSGTALLIVVGVALDTLRQLEAHLLMRQYEGFLK